MEFSLPKKKYFRTLVTVEILSNEPLGDDVSISEVANEIIYGRWLGRVIFTPSQEIKAPKARRLLQKQGYFGTTYK
jgi:hypothetical protein